jgi:hypothetical protein
MAVDDAQQMIGGNWSSRLKPQKSCAGAALPFRSHTVTTKPAIVRRPVLRDRAQWAHRY